MGSLILLEHIMASLPFEDDLQKRGSGANLADGYHVARWTRYADMAAVAGVGFGLLAAVFGILDYQRRSFGDMIAPIAVSISEMDKRLSGEIQALDKRLSGEMRSMDERLSGEMKGLEIRLGDKIDATNRLLDETNERLTGLEKEVGGINVRLGRLEGKVGK